MGKTEIFKDIYGYEGLYQISNFGNVKSAKSAEKDGFDHSAISKCCRGILKTSKGFIWKFKEE